MSRVLNDMAFGLQRHDKGIAATGRPFLLGLFGVFAVVMLVALLVGLQGYRAIADERDATDGQRLAYGSLVNTVKAFDAIDAFWVSEYEGNDVLSMQQRTSAGTYLMLLYVHEGMLMQQYTVAVDVAISPEKAHPLFATDTFRVTYENDLLTLATDTASPCIYLTCPQPSLEFKVAQSSQGVSESGDA